MKYTNFDGTHAFVERWRHSEKFYLQHKAAGREMTARRNRDDLNLVQHLFGSFLQDALARKNKDIPVEVVSVVKMQTAMDALKDVDHRKITLDAFLMAMGQS